MLIRINGRLRFYNSITKVTKVGTGRWEVERNGDTYRVEGGRAAGGRHTDWFVESRHWVAPIWTTSLVDSLKLIDNT